MNKVLFIDRDGTLIVEPQPDQQVDNFSKFRFLPGVIKSLGRIAHELDYQLVMVTNQDGLGTEAFPEENFWPVHNMMLQILADEGIEFGDIFIDRSFPHQNLPSRKPGTSLLKKYLTGSYDLKHSFVIGDRLTDIQLAKNLGSKAISICLEQIVDEGLAKTIALQAQNWEEIYLFLKLQNRFGALSRKTSETAVRIELSPDGDGLAAIDTGIGFFDHMLEQLARHGNMDLLIQAKGDLHIDVHHTIEDVGIALGKACANAIGKKIGMQRYGFYLPMDEADAKVLIDFGGRSFFKWRFKAVEHEAGGIPITLFEHFFKSFSDAAKCNLHIKAKGSNTHHVIEAIFKAFAKAIQMAMQRNKTSSQLPSTKGLL